MVLGFKWTLESWGQQSLWKTIEGECGELPFLLTCSWARSYTCAGGKITATELDKVKHWTVACGYVFRNQSHYQVATLAQLNDVHFIDGLWDDFSVLLSNSDHLCHVLHRTDGLADLTTNSDQRLTTVGNLCCMLAKVRRLFASVSVSSGCCSR